MALLLATALIHRELHLTFFATVVLIPQLVATFGAAWWSPRSAFFSDIAQHHLDLMAWMYLTPIIYPESIVPERYRPFINANLSPR